MEKGQCPTITTWEGVNIRSRKSTPTATTPGQVDTRIEDEFLYFLFLLILIVENKIFSHRHRYKEMEERKPTDDKAYCPLPGPTSIRV